MTWQPGRPVVTATDNDEWQAWRKTSKLQAQRERRLRYRRIDYYPRDEAQAVIDSRTGRRGCGDYSSVIDALVLAAADELPE
jgi:MoxR-like ATPase